MLAPDEWSFTKPGACLALLPHPSLLREQVEGRKGSQSPDGTRQGDALQVIIVLAIRAIGIPIIPRLLTQKRSVLCKPPQVLRADLPSAR